LLYKLARAGITGRALRFFKALYDNNVARVRLGNSWYTDVFEYQV
jgi:hypothetical protein